MMKKKISIVLAAVLCLACLAGCAPKENAEAVVSKGIDALKALDRETYNLYWGDGSFDDVLAASSQSDDTETSAKILGLIVKNLEYTITGSTEDLKAGTATVTADVTNLDMKAVITEWFNNYFTQLLQTALDPNATQLTEEESDALGQQLLCEAFDAEGIEKTTTSVTFDLVLVDNEWKITANDENLDVLMGGFISSLNEISNEMSN